MNLPKSTLLDKFIPKNIFFKKAVVNSKIKAEFTDNLKKYIAKTGYDPEFGARPLKRAITNTINNQLSIKLLNWEVNSWDNITLDIDQKWNLIVKKD